MITSKNISIAFGVTFVLAGLLGFIPNPLVAPDGIFAVNTMHNLVHLLTGAAFLTTPTSAIGVTIFDQSPCGRAAGRTAFVRE